MKKLKRWLAGFCASALLTAVMPQTLAQAEEPLGLCINEVMTSNSILKNENGLFADWVEITNRGNKTESLTKCLLMKESNLACAFQFPNMSLAPGESVVIWMDGLDRAKAGAELHSMMGLDCGGETLDLARADGTILDRAEVPNLEKGAVYCRDENGDWAVSYCSTPGSENIIETDPLALRCIQKDANGTQKAAGSIRISEVMTGSTLYLKEEGCPDYVELTNTGRFAKNISGWYLSDDPSKPAAYEFPRGTVLAPNETLLVYCDGKEGNLHAQFRLNSDGETIVLNDAMLVEQDRVVVPMMEKDTAYSLVNGVHTTQFPPTPGMPNTEASAAAAESRISGNGAGGIVINEVMAVGGMDLPDNSKEKDPLKTADWVELYNGGSQTVNLSGWGLSDSTNHPRKWRFGSNAVIAPGEYLCVHMKALNVKESEVNTNYSLNPEGGFHLTLTDENKNIVDTVFIPRQMMSYSYNRGRDGYFYSQSVTPGAANVEGGYLRVTEAPQFSVGGGIYAPGTTLSVELSAEEGAVIHYTLDTTEPTESSPIYSGPITVNDTAVIRAKAYRDNSIASYANSHAYIFGEGHTTRIISVVADQEELLGVTGIYANYNEDREIEGHIDVFEANGSTTLDQNCGIKIFGGNSRKYPQKSLKFTARNMYGDAWFDAALFSNRNLTEYRSFVVRDSEEQVKSRIRCPVLTTLARPTDILYQESEVCVVYLNGAYWGQYSMRERVGADWICQQRGWPTSEAADLDIVWGNSAARQGSNQSFEELLAWLDANGCRSEEGLAYVDSIVDVENYKQYVALQMFFGNADLLNVKRYKNRNRDDRWRWILYDLDWAFTVDTNSVSRWLDPEGVGVKKVTNNKLFVNLMTNPVFKDSFLTYIGEMMATEWTTEKIVAKIDVWEQLLDPEMERQCARWESPTYKRWKNAVAEFRDYAELRPGKLMGYFQYTLNLTNEEMEHYFGNVPAAVIPFNGKLEE